MGALGIMGRTASVINPGIKMVSSYLFGVIVQVRVVFRKTVVGD